MKTPLDDALEEISNKIAFLDKKYETQYGRPDEEFEHNFNEQNSFYGKSFVLFDCNGNSNWSAWLDYLQTGKSQIIFGCLGDDEKDLKSLEVFIRDIFKKFEIEETNGVCNSYLEEGCGWEYLSYITFKVNYQPKDFYSVGELIQNLVENVFLESEIDEGILIAMKKVAVFCDEKFNKKEFSQVVDMFLNCSEDKFIENVIGICDKEFLKTNDLDPYYLDYQWETIYRNRHIF